MTMPNTIGEVARNALAGDREALDRLVRARQGDIHVGPSGPGARAQDRCRW